MTYLDDFDRSLGDFLRDGPSVAPEPPVIAALAHARATPRRRDPFAAFRRDVMARPLAIGGLRPGLALAAAALIVAAIGIAIAGSGTSRETVPTPSAPVIAPGESTSPSPTETPHPSEAPTVTPTPLPRVTDLPPLGAPRATPVHVAFDQCCADNLSVDVVDESGHLVRAVSGPNVEGGSAQDVTIANDDARTLRITWPGAPCDTVHRLTIDPSGTSIVIDRPACFGDATPADRIVVLTFDIDVDAATIRGDLVTGRGGVDLPSWTATPIDAANGVVRVSIFDRSQSISRVEAVDVTDHPPLGADSDLSDQAPDVVRLLWNGCDPAPSLVVDASARGWALVEPTRPCDTPRLWGLDLTFRGPLAPDTVSVAPATAIP